MGGYQPTLATDLAQLQERITTTQKGSITSVQAVYVPADDLTDPAPATTFAHLDATTVLLVALRSWVSTLLSIPSILPLVLWMLMSSERDITLLRDEFRKFYRTIDPSKILSLFSVWTNFPRRIR